MPGPPDLYAFSAYCFAPSSEMVAGLLVISGPAQQPFAVALVIPAEPARRAAGEGEAEPAPLLATFMLAVVLPDACRRRRGLPVLGRFVAHPITTEITIRPASSTIAAYAIQRLVGGIGDSSSSGKGG